IARDQLDLDLPGAARLLGRRLEADHELHLRVRGGKAAREERVEDAEEVELALARDVRPVGEEGDLHLHPQESARVVMASEANEPGSESGKRSDAPQEGGASSHWAARLSPRSPGSFAAAAMITGRPPRKDADDDGAHARAARARAAALPPGVRLVGGPDRG